MGRINFHVHSDGCDGKLSPREVVEQAVRSEVTHICFTDHFFVPKEVKDYEHQDRHSDEYHEELKSLREEFSDVVDISIGAEVDWIEGYEDWYRDLLASRDFDFLLGAVHFLKKPCGNVDWVSRFEEMVDDFDGVRGIVEKYYDSMKMMIGSGLVNCVSHMDLFKKYLVDRSILDEDWYRDVVVEVLDLMVEKKVCLEINASGWRFAGEQYPSRWILEEARLRGIPVTIGNDFHTLEHCEFDADLDRAADLARDVGYESVLIFKNGKPVEVEI